VSRCPMRCWCCCVSTAPSLCSAKEDADACVVFWPWTPALVEDGACSACAMGTRESVMGPEVGDRDDAPLPPYGEVPEGCEERAVE
jgi:hypothetical protein